MKFCPQCQTTYSDDTLVFCLSDGAKLVPVSTTEKTVAIQGIKEPLKVNIPSRQISDSFTPPTIAQTRDARRGISPWIVFPLVGILFLFVAGLLAYIFLRPAAVVVSNSNVMPTPNAVSNKQSAAIDNETANLKEELEILKKQVANQRTQTKVPNNPNSQKNDSSNSSNSPAPAAIQTARANSPNDGFLALRSIPDATNGTMLAKIPHGTNLEIIGCQQKDTQLPGKLRGRWCRTNYNGQDGWVFDAFLKY